MKKHNFNPGPSILPQVTIENTAKAIIDFEGSGLSLMEVSHRDKAFIAVMDEACATLKELLNVPDEYKIIFLGSGASIHFCMVPMNLLNKKAAYLVTGAWASKAYKESQIIGETIEVASSKDKNYCYIPKNYEIPKDADYFHITTNNTIYGTEIRYDINSPIPLVADASSDILSRPMDVSKYGIIYGGVQKNMGPSGLGFAIIREDLLGKVDRKIPTYLDYRTHIKEASMFNTPPVVPVYATLQTLKWLKNLGGLKAMEKINIDKAELLYNAIDTSKMFVGTANKEDRSLMNITFVMKEQYKELEADFVTFAKERGIIGIKGHRSIGGFRASTYNALPKSSVQVLVDAMNEFEKLKA